MSENFDLNALRQKAAQQEQAPKSKEEQIAELQEKISNAENLSERGKELDRFNSSSPEEQEAEIGRVAKNRNLAPGSYTLEDRRGELSEQDSGLQISTIRLKVWKDELAQLLGKSNS